MRKIFYSLVIVFVVLIGIIGMQESFALSPPADIVEKAYARSSLLGYTLFTVIGIAVAFVIMFIVFKKIKKRQV